MALLEVKNVCKRFGAHEVLHDINFTLQEGEVIAIIGSSGSGKTTLLRCVNFVERMDTGKILLRGKTLFDAASDSWKDEEIRRKRLHFGLVFQSFNLFPQYTALGNVTLARKLAAREQDDFKNHKGEVFKEIEREGMELLEQMGLSVKRDFYPYQLSGGQQQRVAIARALAMKPDIMCFDEPTSALDPELTGEVLKVIRGLALRNTTMIIVTHEMNFARQLANNILFMDEGLVVDSGTPEALLDNPSSERLKRFLETYEQA